MKKTLLALVLFGCGNVNKAEVIAKGQNPTLTCDVATTSVNHIDVAVCYATAQDGKVITYLTVTGQNYPFQAYPLKTLKEMQEPAKTEPAPNPPFVK